ncbi:MAG TPA: hypothetical protein VL426_06930 [Candidatus Binatia bacterium]|jgi:hypothetical protein|nr:hypothetical protein [Candidatus Binatia bacterium]
MNWKRLLLIILFIGVTLGIGYALFRLFFAAPQEVVPTEEQNANGAVGGLPSANVGGVPGAPPPTGAPGLPPGVSPVANGGLTVVTPVAPVPTTGATLSASGQLNYYNRNDGKFYRLNPDGTTTSLSNKTFFNVSNAKFDPQGNKAILEYPDGSNIMFNFQTGEQATLPAHWEGFDFNPTGTQIVAKSVGVDPDARFLVVANPDGSGAKAVQELGENQDKVQVNWSPNNEVIATATTGRSFGVDRQEVYLIGQNGENFKSMIVEGLDFRPKWAPGGEQLMYSVAGSLSDWKPQLWIVDAQGDNIGRNRRSIAVNTWADKCTFQDKDNLYCAVPDDLPRGAGLQPDIANDTPDSIYKINLTTGLQTKIAVPEGSHTIGSVMLTPDKKSLFFTDKGSGVVNKIALP